MSVAAKYLIIGSVSGWASGFLVSKYGKPFAFVLGGGIIASQIAHQAGYSNMDWPKIKSKAQETSKSITNNPELGGKAKQFFGTNPYFAAGFFGGFLIGVAT